MLSSLQNKLMIFSCEGDWGEVHSIAASWEDVKGAEEGHFQWVWDCVEEVADAEACVYPADWSPNLYPASFPPNDAEWNQHVENVNAVGGICFTACITGKEVVTFTFRKLSLTMQHPMSAAEEWYSAEEVMKVRATSASRHKRHFHKDTVSAALKARQ